MSLGSVQQVIFKSNLNSCQHLSQGSQTELPEESIQLQILVLTSANPASANQTLVEPRSLHFNGETSFLKHPS